MSSIDVQPGERPGKMPVGTNKVSSTGIHWPVYNAGFGAAGDTPTQVDSDNPLPTTDSEALSEAQSMVLLTQKLTASLNTLIKEQSLTNLYLSKVVGEDLRTDNELENR